MKIRLLLFLPFLFVTLTSVYCDRNKVCSGTVYSQETGEVLDSVTVNINGNESYTDENGTYSRHITVKGKEPRIQFYKDTLGFKEIIGCKKNETVYL